MNISAHATKTDNRYNLSVQSRAHAFTSHTDPLADRALPLLVVIDNRVLERECLVHGLNNHEINMNIHTVSSYEQWQHQKRGRQPAAILYHIGSQKTSDPNVGSHISRLVTENQSVPVVVLADKEDISQIVKALQLGAKGYIPTSVSVNVCVEALRLAMAGGTFVPASSVLAFRHASETGTPAAKPMNGMFTQRQAEVVNALRRGKANKIIAYELNLRESTVKVHIRNIMKKLKASNRTEVACIINELFPSDSSFSDF